jgi:hypothetical protein
MLGLGLPRKLTPTLDPVLAPHDAMDSPRKVFGDASNLPREPRPKGVKRNPFAYLTQQNAKRQRMDDSAAPIQTKEDIPPRPESTTRDSSMLAYGHYLSRGASVRALRTSASRSDPLPRM